MKKLFFLGGINIAILIVLILLIEIVIRLVFPSTEIPTIFNDEKLRTRGRAFVESHPIRGFALKSGFSNALYTINSKGFRGEEFPANLNKKRVILTLGESTTFGWGVRNHETYPFYLAQDLAKNYNTYVINGGIPSYTSSQTLEYLKETLDDKELAPDMLLVNILWNDIWYSTIANWHPDILVFQKPPQWLTFLTRHSRLVHGLMMGFVNDNNLHDIFNESALRQYEQNIETMIVTCQENGIPLAFVEPPFDGDHLPDAGLNEFHVRYSRDFFIETAAIYLQKLHAIAARYHVPVISHRLDMRNLHQEALFLDTLHPTPEGNKMMASDIYSSLLPLL